VPVSADNNKYVLTEDLILAFAPIIFGQYSVVNSTLIRLVRNADISIDDDRPDDLELKSKDYRKAMEKMIATRKRMGAIKMEYTGKIDANLIAVICEYLKLPKKHAFYSDAPLDLGFLGDVSAMLSDRKELYYPLRVPQPSPNVSEDRSMIEQIKKKDILLSYPYESMRPFLRLLTEAANDPDVVSIRITLYRVAKTSQIVAALAQAAENGKDVLALVELRARFDEANNVDQSLELEKSGCRIIYGLDKIKVHSKLCLITRRTVRGVEYITQIGTGNYNEKTARLYTDYSLMTANPAIGEEAASVFNALALGDTVKQTNHLLVAPDCLQNEIVEKIDTQIAIAKAGKPAYIGFKINSLTDKLLIDKLIEASSAGVRVQMLVRGICCLVTGVPGLTENIEIYSIVGRYLEHGRIYIFGCEGNEEVYIASADLMTRNTTRRVEVGVPVLNARIRAQLLKMFRLMLSDTCKLRVQQDDGTYVKVVSDGKPFNSQEYFAESSYRRANIPLPEEENPSVAEEIPAEKMTAA
ncbi:MAG: polyphosphate kinase 1, partial [Lachnospiraceae bacterium]|nr:polyphosphate kinase 1 [Lachnospiraceae bacterium]